MTPSRRAWLLLSLVLVVLLAGCGGMGAFGGETDAGGEVREKLNATEPPAELFATVETTVEIDGERVESETTDRWLRDDGTSRTESVDDDYVVVTDGEQSWHHNRTTGSVWSIDLAETEESRLERIYAEQERYFEDFDVTNVGETSVDGRAAYEVTFEQPATETVERSVDVLVGETVYQFPIETAIDASDAEEVTIAFDRDTMFPLAYEMTAETSTFEITYTDATFDPDPGFDDELFAFGPPEEAPPGEIELPIIEEYDTIPEASEAAPVDVSEPSAVPDGFSLETIRVSEYPDEDRTAAQLHYRTDDESIQISVSDGPPELSITGESVDVGGAEATMAETDQGAELEWERGGQHYHLFGSTALETDTVLAIAESLD